jgi:hypothetical protein
MNADKQLAEVRRFERAQRLWPALRLVVGRHLSRRCRRCVLSERHGPLDAEGLCRACAGFVPVAGRRPDIRSGPNPFDELMAATAGRVPGRYDAILLVSGGKDSAYLLHRLRQDHPSLRLLTLLVDNGFMSRLALDNVADLCRRFDVEHLALHTAPGIVREVFRWGLTNIGRQRGYSVVDLLDGQMTFDSALNLAADLGIPQVIAGLSRTQSENVGLHGWEWPQAGYDLPAYVGCPRTEAFADPQRRFWYHADRVPEARRPRFLTPFSLWDPSESFLLAEVDRLGLLPVDRRDPIATNNALIPVIGLAEVARFGYSSFEVEFAREVREGKADRARWLRVFEMLEYAARTGSFLGEGVTGTLAAFGLKPHDIGL